MINLNSVYGEEAEGFTADLLRGLGIAPENNLNQETLVPRLTSDSLTSLSETDHSESTISPRIVDSFSLPSWGGLGFTFRKNITIDSTKVPGNLNDFPVLIDLNGDPDLFGVQQSSGNDIMFTDDQGTKLDHEIEKFDQTIPQLVAWVKMDLSGSVDTTISMYFGNKTVSNQENPSGVWNSNYQAVFHLNGDPTSIVYDSTSNDNDGNSAGSMTGTDQVEGKFDGSINFDGTDDYINIGDVGSNAWTGLTLEAWVFQDANSGDDRVISKSPTGTVGDHIFSLTIDDASNLLRTRIATDGTGGSAATSLLSSSSISFGTWHHLVVTWDSGSEFIRMYIDGSLDVSYGKDGDSIDDSTQIVAIANVNEGLDDRYYDGKIDEVRISRSARSTNWIEAGYNNQYQPSTFYSTGALEGGNDFTEDFVDVLSDVDSNSDKGSHDLFADLQATDLIYDNMTEEAESDPIARGNSAQGQGGTNTLTISHSLGYPSGNNRLVVAAAGYENNDSSITVNSITYNGQSMTEIAEIQAVSGYSASAAIYYILDSNLPSTTGSYNVRVTCSADPQADIWLSVIGYINVDQSAPDDSDSDMDTTGVTMRSHLTVIEDGTLLVQAAVVGNIGSFTPESGTVEVLTDEDTSSSSAVFNEKLAQLAGAQSIGTDHSSMNRGAWVAACFAPVSASNFQLDQEVQFTGVYDSPTVIEELRIKTGTFGGSENLELTYWDGDSWELITSALTESSWNNISVLLTSPTYTIRFRGSVTSSDNSQDWWEIDSVLLMVEGPEEVLGEDSGFIWLDSPDEVDLGITYNSWVQQDLSDDSIPNNATGVIIAWVEESITDHNAVARGSQDTNDYMNGGSLSNRIEAETWRMQTVKLSEHKYIDTWRESSTTKLYVMGYTLGSDPHFRRVASDLGNLVADSSWNRITVSGVNENTTGVILFAQSISNSDATILVRAVGSTDSMSAREWEEYNSGGLFVKLDSNDQFEYTISSGRVVKFYLIAEVTDSIDWLDTNRDDISATSTGWITIDLDSYVTVPSTTSGVILQHESTGSLSDYKNIARQYSQSWSFSSYDVGGDQWIMGGSGIDEENRIQIYAENLEQDVYIHALTLYSDKTTPSINSFGFDDPGTGTVTFWADIIDQSATENVTLTVNGTDYQMSNNGTTWTKDLEVDWKGYYTYQITNISDISGNFMKTPSALKNHTFSYDNIDPSVIDWEYYQGLDGTWDNQNNTFVANVSDSWGEIHTVLLEVTTHSLIVVMTEYQNISNLLGFINDTLDLPNGDMEFRIIANDTNGNEITTSLHSGSVFYNHPPQAQNLILSPSNPRSNETLFHLEWDYDDDDSGITSESGTEIKWYRDNNNGSGFLLQSSVLFTYDAIPDWPGIDSADLIKGEQWYASVRPKDGGLFGEINISSTITILNTPPTITSVDISPSSAPTTSDPLVASWQSSDSDSDNLQYNVSWYLNGVFYSNWVTSTTLATLNPGNTSKYQQWYFTVQVDDGSNYSSIIPLGYNITITNSKPTAINANFTDIQPTNDTNLNITYIYYDPDDDSENKSELVVIWYKDWVYQPQFDDYTTINSNETNIGEIWTFFISVSDNESLHSGNIPSITGASIGGGFTNTLPNANDLTLTPSTPTTTNILNAGYLFADVDIGQEEIDYEIRWYMNGSLQTDYNDNDTVPTSATLKGQQWYFTVRVFDGLAWGPLNTSTTITILNSIPTITSANFIESDVRTIHNLTFNYFYQDNDGESVSILEIRWYRSTDQTNYILNSSYDGLLILPYTATLKNDRWKFNITITDGHNNSNWFYSDYIEIKNSLPWIDPYSIVLTGGLTTSDPISVTYMWYDDDAEDLQAGTTFAWENSTRIIPNDNILESSFTKAGETWTVTITPRDGTDSGPIVNSKFYGINVLIGNTPPEIPDNEIKIQGHDPANGSYIDGVVYGTNLDLVVRYNVTDIDGVQGVSGYDVLLVDGYALFSEYQWYRNRSGIISLITALNGRTTVPSTYTERGDLWWVKVRPRDLYGYFGTEKTSTAIFISNSAPFLTNVSWDKTIFYTKDDLSFTYNFDDYDQSDAELGLNVEWYLNGINQSAFYNFVGISSQNVTKGETWSARIRVWDGDLYSIWYQLDNITLLNTAPVVSDVLLNPMFPTATQDLVVFWSYFDYDNDSEQSIRIRWYNNDILQTALNNLDTVNASYLSKGEEWYVSVEVFDGENYSPLINSSLVVILNSPPILINVSLWNNNDLSNTVFADGTISIFFPLNYTDADNDLVDFGSILTRWYRNGIHIELYDDLQGIPSSELQKHDFWNVSVQILDVDGTVWSNNYVSQAITVINKAPEVSNLIIIQSTGYLVEDENITILFTISDPDINDTDNSLLVWVLNGVPQPQFENQSVIPYSATTPGDIWTIFVTPSDGYNTGLTKNKSILIESRPRIQNLTAVIEQDFDGHFTFGLQVLDTLHDITSVEYRVFLNGTELDKFSTVNSPNATNYWLLDYILSNTEYYNTEALIEIKATSIIGIESIRTFNFSIVDRVAPRVSDTGLGVWFVKNSNDPTHLSFFADIEEHGAGVANITLHYYYSPYVVGEGSSIVQDFTPILMIFNGSDGSTLTYAVTVPYPQDDEDYEVLYYVSTQDLEGNSDSVAFDIRDYPGRNDPILHPAVGGLPEWVLLIAGLAVFLIFMGSVVYVRFIRKPEIVGLDKGLVMKGVSGVNDEEIISGVDRHTLGLVVSFFDQSHGPIPIIVIPEMLKDNYSKLVALSDKSFSTTQFSEEYSSEEQSSYDFNLGEQLRISVLSFGFALEKPDARGGQENLTLNILVHKDIFKLIEQFKDEIQDKVHEFHLTMAEDSANKVMIRIKANEVRKYVSAIVLSYVDVYGTTELIEDEED
jgi:hypothetical protein